MTQPPAAMVGGDTLRFRGAIAVMATFQHWLCHPKQLAGTPLTLLVATLRDAGLCLPSPVVLVAENLFLRKQLAL